MEDRKTPRMHIYGESEMTPIMTATVHHLTTSSGLRKFQAAWFLLNRGYVRTLSVVKCITITCFFIVCAALWWKKHGFYCFVIHEIFFFFCLLNEFDSLFVLGLHIQFWFFNYIYFDQNLFFHFFSFFSVTHQVLLICESFFSLSLHFK